MRLRVLAVAVALTAFVFLSVAPETASAQTVTRHANYWSTCTASRNACMVVENSYRGSDHVIAVSVWTVNTSRQCYTFRVLFDGYARYANYNCNLSAYFPIGYNVNPGRCIQGGVEGLTDARTGCWWAP
ncbi:MAG: hypothetical protein J2P43_10355 [Candidatus Dormibacteraeota bacterium]|nr:hypothetical protein [Candidatus Dormibacteraeota bacterium]MBO0745412.1 hypothetical protein [Candidatus Dormibacteraeota bacterium]